MFLVIEYEYWIINNRCFSLLVDKVSENYITFVEQTRCQESISEQNTATRTVGNPLPQNLVIFPKSLL